MSILSWLKRRRLDDEDFQEEIRAHIKMAAEERMADGADRESARLASLKEFGNVALTTEAARRVFMPRWLEALHDLWHDVRYAIRSLRKNPAYSLTVVGVLALGIGLNAAVFTMLKGTAFAPLAGVEHSARLHDMFSETSTGRKILISYPDYQYIRDHDQAFTGLFGSVITTVGLGRGERSRPIFCELVTGNYFDVLGVRAQRGRTLQAMDEVAPGQHPVIVISDGLWRRDFDSDPDIVGKTIEVNNFPLTVAGVADATYHGTIVSYDVEAFIPVLTAPQLGYTFGSKATTPSGIFADKRAGMFYPQGFLRPGVSRESAIAQTHALWTALVSGRPLADVAREIRVVPFWQSPGSAQSYILPTLTVISAMGLLVLMIACANIAGLVLVRGISRRGEIAVRLALGASRTRIVRLLIAENLVLALPGAGIGLVLAWYGIPVLIGYGEALAAPSILYFNSDVDGLVIGFAALVACGCALVFGFVPALQSSRIDLVSVMKDNLSPRGPARGRLRAGLVVAQVAVSVLLLVGAALVTRSLDAALNADPGFEPGQTTAIELDVKQGGYDEAHGRVFYRQLLESARADAGVDMAALASWEPLHLLETPSLRVAIDGYDPGKGQDLAFQWNSVSANYFGTLGISILAGREFRDDDDETTAGAAIVNSTAAERFWGSPNGALGKRIRVGDGDWRTIVGVAADVKYMRVTEAPRPYVYLPFFQFYRADMVLHTHGPVAVNTLVEQARARVAALDADLPILSARSLGGRNGGSLIFMRLAAMMLLIFGVAGMILAALGTYGLVSYVVKQSTHEIGIRMALGASRVSVVREFLSRGLKLGAMGAVLGVLIALTFSGLLQSALYGVSATDAISFVRALAVVLGTVIVATAVPAWRAAQTDPLAALRHQ